MSGAKKDQGGWFVVHPSADAIGGGVLRREVTRAEAVRWCSRWYVRGRVMRRETINPGSYEYVVGGPPEYIRNAGTFYITRRDRLHWSERLQTPLYPKADQPYKLVERKE